MDYKQTALDILKAIGGKENVVSAAHCATRLRLVIADNSKCDKKTVENIDGVKGVFEASGQLQIIIGTGAVNKVYDEFIAAAGISAATTAEVKQAAVSKAPWYKQAVKTQPVPGRGHRHDHDPHRSGQCLERGHRHGYSHGIGLVRTV